MIAWYFRMTSAFLQIVALFYARIKCVKSVITLEMWESGHGQSHPQH